jgi:hypothetical protein
MSRTYRGELPVRRFCFYDYNGIEFREVMTPGGLVYYPEPGYCFVRKGQQVWVYLNTLTNGHGGNRYAEYVWVATTPDASAEHGWLPNCFYSFGEAQRLALARPLATRPSHRQTAGMPAVLEDMMPHTPSTSSATAATSSATAATPPVIEATMPLTEATLPATEATPPVTETTPFVNEGPVPDSWGRLFTETFDC